MLVKIFKPLFSNKLTSLLLLAYAGSMAYATFLENDFGTQAVQSLIYRAWWFELIHGLLALNFIGNIWRYKLYRKEKLAILTFHLAFVVILIGAMISRYVSFEGIMLIREGDSSNQIVSQYRYLNVKVEKGEEIETYEERLDLSYFKQPDFLIKMGDNDEIIIEPKAFVPKAEQQVVPSETGSTVLKIVVTGESGRQDLYLASGSVILVNNFPVSFDRPMDGAVNIYSVGNELQIEAPFDMNYMVMATQSAGALPADSLMGLKTRALYRSESVTFVVPEVYENSAVVYRQTKNQEKGKTLDDLLFVQLKSQDQKQELFNKLVEKRILKLRFFRLSY